MSLLDSDTTHVAEVYVEVETTDDLGNVVLVPAEEPVEVKGRLQPSTTEEAAQLGQVVETLYRFTSRTFPGGPFARVKVDGRDWDVLGTPKRYSGSAATAHVTTMLKER